MADLTIQDFKSMFNTNKLGDFKTGLEKTHGQLTLRNGKLVNVNRYDRGKTKDIETRKGAPITEGNWNIRCELVNALMRDSGLAENSDFICAAREKLGLSEPKIWRGLEKPLSRRTVKAILMDYQKRGYGTIQTHTK